MADGFEHPATEEELVALVKRAHDEGLGLRVRGAAHSMARAIYTDPGPGEPALPNTVSVQEAPRGPNLDVMLDRYRGLTWIDEANGIVEVEAGIHLGRDPLDPTGTATLQVGLLYQAFLKGWTLRDLGGITHQTVGGFLSTGSSGGSLQHGIDENIVAFRVIDGKGEVRWIEKDADPDLFDAVGVSLGLLGVISKVRFKLTRAFNIYGQEATTPASGDECPIDLFGPGGGGKPSLGQFLENAPYARILWWPQEGTDRIVTWQAIPWPATPGFDPIPYAEFSEEPEIEELVAGIFFTIAGNLDDLSQVSKKLDKGFSRFEDAVDLALETWGLGNPASDVLAKILVGGFEGFTGIAVAALAPVLRATLPEVFPEIINLFQPMTTKGKPTVFQDYSWRSLPMDNGVDDVLLGTEFTEIWIPIEHTERTMQLLKQHFDSGGIDATGYFSTELYAAQPSRFWLSPSYGGAMFRVDPFWYVNNEGNPAAKGEFFSKFWELLRDNHVPFRLHWGKALPDYDAATWADYLRSQYPKWDDFMALRAERDPRNVFLTEYWRRHLFGLG